MDIPEQSIGKALSNPLRVKILQALEVRAVSPTKLSDERGEPLGNVAYHVRRLHDLGLLELVDSQPRRGAVEHYYRATVRVTLTVEPINHRRKSRR